MCCKCCCTPTFGVLAVSFLVYLAFTNPSRESWWNMVERDIVEVCGGCKFPYRRYEEGKARIGGFVWMQF